MANNPITGKDFYAQTGEIAALKQELESVNGVLQQILNSGRAMNAVLSKLNFNKPGDQAKLVDLAAKVERLKKAQEQAAAAAVQHQTKIAQLTASLEKAKQQAAQTAIQNERLAQAQNRTAISANRLAASQNQVANSANRHGGSLRNLLQSIRTITYAYFSLAAAQRIVSTFFNETKELNSLDFAYKAALGSIQATTQAKEYLLDITERLGIDLLTTSRAYLRFATAAKQSNVDVKQTQEIFSSVSKASAVLGLGVERTGYVFLALEQIMSKGRLSTEELRRQLGEHLPGAFGIAADALGVTTAKLTDMLKKGEVLSSTFLPKFARQIEIAYGIQNVKKVDNLAAAQARFGNEFTKLVQKIDASGAFKSFFNFLTGALKLIADNIDTIALFSKAVIYLGLAWLALKAPVIATTAATWLATRAQQAFNTAVKANPIGLAISAFALLLPLLQTLFRSLNGVTNVMLEMKSVLDSLRTSVIEENQAVRDNIKVLGSLNSTQAERLKAFNALSDQYPGILSNYDLEKISLRDLITLQDELTAAIVRRVAEERKLDNTKQLQKDLEAAGRFIPKVFGTKNRIFGGDSTIGIDQSDIDRERQKLTDKAFADFAERQSLIDQAGDQLLEFLNEYNRTNNAIAQDQITLNKAREIEVELQKELNKLTDEELLKIKEQKRPQGRSFGGATGFSNELRRKIAEELLASRAANAVPEDPDADKKAEKAFNKMIARLKKLNSFMEDGYEKELDMLRIKLLEEKHLNEDGNAGLLEIEENHLRRVSALNEKYIQLRLKQRQDAMIDGQEKDIAALNIWFDEQKKEYAESGQDIAILEQQFRDKLTDILNKYIDEKDKIEQEIHNRTIARIEEEFEANQRAFRNRAVAGGASDVSLGQIDILLEIESLKFRRELHRTHQKHLTDDALKEVEARINALNTLFIQGENQIAIDTLKSRQALDKKVFDSEKHTARERREFNRKQAIELYELQLKLSKDLTVAQRADIENAIAELKAIKDTPDIFSLIGISFKDDAQKQALIDSFAFIKSQLTEFLSFQKDIIEQEIELADRKVKNAEENLKTQLQYQQQGYAHNVAQAQKDLELAKKQQEQALRERKKFQKQELILNSALEASHLAVAIANVAKQGGIFAPALIAALLATFFAAKLKALQLVNKQTFRKGGFKEIGGGTHESGNDTNVGGNNYAEVKESVGIFNAKATRKYKPELKRFTDAANKGMLDKYLLQNQLAIKGIAYSNMVEVDTSVMEGSLKKLVMQGDKKIIPDGKGNYIIKDRGRTTLVRRTDRL